MLTRGGQARAMSLPRAKLSPSKTAPEPAMTADTLDRLVFHVAVVGGLIALLLLPW